MSFVFEDPLSLEIMVNAVVTLCGHSFSQQTIKEWLVSKNTCPLCNTHLTLENVKPNYSLRDAITLYLKKNTQQNGGEFIANEETPLINSVGATIKEINPADVEKAAYVGEQAFRNDPSVKYIYNGNDSSSGQKWLTSCMLDYGVRRGRVWAAYSPTESPPKNGANETETQIRPESLDLSYSKPSLDLCGYAIWQPPFEAGVSVFEMLYSGMASAPFHMGLRPSFRAMSMLGKIEKMHKECVTGPHWTLYSVGVAPHCQNLGIGTSLLLPILETADSENLAVYTDTASERSLRFFERLGFRIVKQINEAGLPPVWGLVRQPDTQ